MIKKVTLQDDFSLFSALLNEAFSTVARQFGLTKENSPTNNAFISTEELKEQLTDKREFYYSEENGIINGFIAIEQSSRDTTTFYIEKLAVCPEYRHEGIGKQLMDFATGRIKELGGKRISVGLINDHTILKNWYIQQGFKEVEIKTFEHLSFEVCLMEKSIG